MVTDKTSGTLWKALTYGLYIYNPILWAVKSGGPLNLTVEREQTEIHTEDGLERGETKLKRQEVDRDWKKEEERESDRDMAPEGMGKRPHVLQTHGYKSSPDVSPTLHMWLWLTFHLPPSLYLSIHPSLVSHPSVRMSAVFHGMASDLRHKPALFPPPPPALIS